MPNWLREYYTTNMERAMRRPFHPSPDDVALANLRAHLSPEQLGQFASDCLVPPSIRRYFVRVEYECRGFYSKGSHGGRYLILYRDNPNVIRILTQDEETSSAAAWDPFTIGYANPRCGPAYQAFCVYAPARGYAGQEGYAGDAPQCGCAECKKGGFGLPLADFILTLKLAIEYDEPGFLRTANVFGPRLA